MQSFFRELYEEFGNIQTTDESPNNNYGMMKAKPSHSRRMIHTVVFILRLSVFFIIFEAS